MLRGSDGWRERRGWVREGRGSEIRRETRLLRVKWKKEEGGKNKKRKHGKEGKEAKRTGGRKMQRGRIDGEKK